MIVSNYLPSQAQSFASPDFRGIGYSFPDTTHDEYFPQKPAMAFEFRI